MNDEFKGCYPDMPEPGGESNWVPDLGALANVLSGAMLGVTSMVAALLIARGNWSGISLLAILGFVASVVAVARSFRQADEKSKHFLKWALQRMDYQQHVLWIAHHEPELLEPTALRNLHERILRDMNSGGEGSERKG